MIDEAWRGNRRQLQFYQKGRMTRSVSAPWPTFNQISRKENDVRAEIQMRAPEEIGLDSVAIHILLPLDITSPDKLEFSAKEAKPEQLLVFGPFTLHLANRATRPSASIAAEVEAVLAGQTISFRTLLSPASTALDTPVMVSPTTLRRRILRQKVME